ncbi:MAG: dienelactone hydrolase family protein, partial [Planctomycetota bacterium]
TLPVDRDRVYLAGLSMGGYATWELVARTPERWAGAVAICGAGDPSHATRIAAVPVWATHGDVDAVVPIERSRAMIAALVEAGGRPIYSEYPGVGHDSWTPTLGSRHVWDWLFAQRR